MVATLCVLITLISNKCVHFVDGIDAKMETVLGEMEVELDGQFCSVRNTETNLGINFFYLYWYIILLGEMIMITVLCPKNKTDPAYINRFC